MSRALAGGALAALLVALGWAVVNGLGSNDSAAPSPPARGTVVTTPRPKPAAPRAARARFVKLEAAGAFDPEGDGHERDEEAPLAVDGKQSTFWRTERYARFFKSGVGLVLDAGRRVRVQQVVVDSPTPGIRAEIRLGTSAGGPFTRVSASKTLAADDLPRCEGVGPVRRRLDHGLTALERGRGVRGTRPRHLSPVA